MENYAAPVENPWNLPVADAQDLHADAVKFAEKEKEETEDADDADADDGDGDGKDAGEGDDAKAEDEDEGDGDAAAGEDEGKSDVQMLVRSKDAVINLLLLQTLIKKEQKQKEREQINLLKMVTVTTQMAVILMVTMGKSRRVMMPATLPKETARQKLGRLGSRP